MEQDQLPQPFFVRCFWWMQLDQRCRAETTHGVYSASAEKSGCVLSVSQCMGEFTGLMHQLGSLWMRCGSSRNSGPVVMYKLRARPKNVYVACIKRKSGNSYKMEQILMYYLYTSLLNGGWGVQPFLSFRNVNRMTVVSVGNYMLHTALRHSQYGFNKHFSFPIWSILGFEVGEFIQNVIQLWL